MGNLGGVVHIAPGISEAPSRARDAGDPNATAVKDMDPRRSESEVSFVGEVRGPLFRQSMDKCTMCRQTMQTYCR